VRIGDLVKWTDFYGKDHYGIVTLKPSIDKFGSRMYRVLSGDSIKYVREGNTEVINSGVNIP
jgi:hypothetical protein